MKNPDSNNIPFYTGDSGRVRHSCPFCLPGDTTEIILESDMAYVIFDKFPVNLGHALVIPRRHCENYFDLSQEEQIACVVLLNRANDIIQKKYKPDGFNTGVNIGSVAGQTIGHVHIHLIPRYQGDVADPEGGVRGVIPEKRKY